LIDLHVNKLDVSASEFAYCQSLLDEEEMARARQFRIPELENRWVVARSRLKEILAQHCASSPAELRFGSETNGKPILVRPSTERRLHFSISHSHHLAVVGVTELAPIGVDIEYQQSDFDWNAIARRYFAPGEYRQIMALPENHRQHAFYCCWTRKEAVVKATGEGLSDRFRSFEVSVSPDERAEVLTDVSQDAPASEWLLQHLEFGEDFVGAMALRANHVTTHCQLSPRIHWREPIEP